MAAGSRKKLEHSIGWPADHLKMGFMERFPMDRQHVPDTWARGDPYEQYVGQWSRQVAPRFLSWLNIPPGQWWLDVGCGTGTLCAAIADHGSPSSVAAAPASASRYYS
jgi:2-polyprenyl-3-methyl-5-hydroxy-6-metoxy-1,4-benzoquinol methylase